MTKLDTLFRGYEEIVPSVFIFFGNFLSDTPVYDSALSIKYKGFFIFFLLSMNHLYIY